MNTIFNFGDPHKDFTPVAEETLGNYEISHIPITNNKIFYNRDLQIVDANYGTAMVLDSLTMLKLMKKLKENDEIIFLGSMGSLTDKINLDDIVIPFEVRDYTREKVHTPNIECYNKINDILYDRGEDIKVYNHGSVIAVFDPSTNHEDYTNSKYKKGFVDGLDCGETYTGFEFCNNNKLKCAALLYCSDDPKNHIANLPKEEFDKRALEFDLKLNEIAKEILLGW